MRAIILLFSTFSFISIRAQEIKFIQNGNSTLAVSIYSIDKPETIILLHGGPGVPSNMIEVVNQLKNRYKVITFEQRGVGLSKCEKCSFTMDDYISDLDIITKKLGVETFHLFGHSWGGLYAQIYAQERAEKIKSLFLSSPSSGTNEDWKKTEKEVMQFNKKVSSKSEWLKMGCNSLLGMLGSDKAYRRIFKQVLKNYDKGYTQSDVEISHAFLSKINSKPINKTRKEIIKYTPLTVFDRIDYPVMITYGSNDIYGESKNKVFDRFPTATVEIISNCGHIPWKNNPTAFKKILYKYFLEKESPA